jgi:hypothetical protein
VKNAGNYYWVDDSGDGIQEPLLDLGNLSIFDPVLIPGSGGETTPNTSPNVSISAPVDGASFASATSISFAGSASDDEDGDSTGSLVWTSSLEGEIGTGGSFSAVLEAGRHMITASVTDSGGLTGSASITITVESSGGSESEITLSVTARKVRGTGYADLAWSGATSDDIEIYRDDVKVATTSNDGAYTDGPIGKGGGSATYKVCGAGTSTCSNTVSVTW